MRALTFPLLVLMMTSLSMCKSTGWTEIVGGQLTIQSSSHAPFPHPLRAAGHVYNDSLYSFEEHYNDSSMAIFIPDHFVPTRTVNLVFYFHGWGNSIQESLDKFELLQQFSESKINAVFVFPEGPRNAPDSFGGKLEDPGVFNSLVEDVLGFLVQEKQVAQAKPGRIILAGHSGAYRVIAFILNRGGLSKNISEVYLFDALYGQVENYTHWLEINDGRFINFVTPDGGTNWNSLDLLSDFEDWGIPFKKFEKNVVSVDDLETEKIVTVFTTLGHSEVINPFFKLALKSSGLKRKD